MNVSNQWRKKIPWCHQVIFKAVNHRSHQPISFSVVKKGATISGKFKLCLPNPSSLRPGAVFIANCSEPDCGPVKSCVSAWLLSTTFVPQTVAHTQVTTFQMYPVPKCFTSKPVKEKKKVLVTQSCPTLCDPWTIAHQAPLSMEVSWQEYWSGLPFPSPGGSSRLRDRTRTSCIGQQVLYR